MTLSEVLLWQKLNKKQIMGYDFDRQKPIDNYIVDFYCKDLQLAIEIDGDSHGFDKVAVNDKKRQTRLESLGVRFLRFDDIDIKTNISTVVAIIQNWIGDNQPTPNPSKEGNN